jgi:hypothetical protein
MSGSFLWIIYTSSEGQIDKSVVLRTKYKSKVGNYIRINIEHFLFVFYKVWLCTFKGKIGKDISKYIKKNDDGKDEYSDNEYATIVNKILEKYSDEEIVDELTGEDRNDGSYANIHSIPIEDIIQL